jgi:hypothetical protein
MSPLILERASAARPSGQWRDDDYDAPHAHARQGALQWVRAPARSPWARSSLPKLSWADTFDVHHWRHASDDNWKLFEPRGGQFFRTEWRTEAPKSTVLLFICRMPTSDPTAW